MTLLLSRREIEKKISYPPLRKKAAKLPSLRCDLSAEVLRTYRAAIREKKMQAAHAAPMLSFDIVAPNPRKTANPTAFSTYEEALALAERGELADATTVLLEAIKQGIDTAEAFATVGDLYKAQHNPAEAVKYYTKALQLVPSEFGSGEWDSVRLFKDKAECYVAMASTIEGAAEQAAAEYDKFMQINNPDFDTLMKAGKVHLDCGHLDRADELLGKALAENDEDPYLYFNLGELSERRHDVAAAKRHFAKAIGLDPSFSEPYIDQAEDLLRKHEAEVGGDGGAAAARGRSPHLINALNLYLSVLKLLPTNATIHTRIADIYDLLGPEYRESSKAMLSRALELAMEDEQMAAAYCRRGLLHLRDHDDWLASQPEKKQKVVRNQAFPGSVPGAEEDDSGDDESDDGAAAPAVQAAAGGADAATEERSEASAAAAKALDEAITDFTMALAVEPANGKALFNRAAASLRRLADGDRQAAARDYETLVAQDVPAPPSFPQVDDLVLPHYYLANWYFNQRHDGNTPDPQHYIDCLTRAHDAFLQAHLLAPDSLGNPLRLVEKSRGFAVRPATHHDTPSTSGSARHQSRAARQSRADVLKAPKPGTPAAAGEAPAAAPAAARAVSARERRWVAKADELREKIMLCMSVAHGCHARADRPPEPAVDPAADPPAPAQVPPLAVRYLQDFYLGRKQNEPTAHTALFNEFQFGWRSVQGFHFYYEALEKARNTADAGKGKKKK
ncbi:UDP-N-acetylglucosamine--peptide N-acetylglucosaminyltransferase [Diplonema papillatum]|nr:UDP-N-acetylglucosamine--peptide N-acetylglucosaminyltransferase [Diplonema papillatum]